MKAIIRLRDKDLGDKIAKALEPMAGLPGNKVYNLPVEKHLSQEEISLLFFEALPYVIDNYVLIHDNLGSTLFELIDEDFARFNPHLVDKLGGICLWKMFVHVFCKSEAELLEEVADFFVV